MFDSWVVKDDEFHPDPGTAAKHADHNADRAAASYHRDQIKRLEATRQRTAVQDVALRAHRHNLTLADQRVTDWEEANDE
jgi:translation initiation factor 2B subunit (eIF-2B alpha/beta/delta family)